MMRSLIFILLLFGEVQAASLVGITPGTPSPGIGGGIVSFTATASGGSGQYQYKFFRLPRDGIWSIVRDWDTDPTYQLNVPAGGGSQHIGVWVRTLGSTAEYEDTGSIFWEAQSAPVPSCGPVVLSALGAAMSNLDALHYLPLANRAYVMGSYAFPFTVPIGRTYEISSIHYVGKRIGDQGGGVILTNLFTLTDNTPLVFPLPLPIPAKSVIDGFFSNNTTSEPMNMMVMIVGKLTGAGC